MVKEQNQDNIAEREKILRHLFQDPHLKSMIRGLKRKGTMFLTGMRRIGQVEPEPKKRKDTLDPFAATQVVKRDDNFVIGNREIDPFEQTTYPDDEMRESREELLALPPEPMEEQEEDEVNWMLDRIAPHISATSDDTFANIVGDLRKSTKTMEKMSRGPRKQPLAQRLSSDIIEYAAKIDVSTEDLWQAMQSEGFSSMQELRETFTDMAAEHPLLQAQNFDFFCQSLVQSYLDTKNERALLGLIGVSIDDGQQNTATPAARLLTEIFLPDVGGIFLTGTKNPNYNCFNIGNLIQDYLLELDELSRISYLENLLSLLSTRQTLLIASQKMVRELLSSTYFIKFFSHGRIVAERLVKYFADMGLFFLAKIPAEELPPDIAYMVPESLEDILEFTVGYPQEFAGKKEVKILFMLKRLEENNPLLFSY